MFYLSGVAKELRQTVTGFVFYDGKLLLIKHKQTGHWFHIGGGVEANETPDEALLREVKEEVGLDVTFLEEFDHYAQLKSKGLFKEVDDFRELPKPFYVHTREFKDHRKLTFDFVCVAKTNSVKIQKEEVDECKWFTKEEIKSFDKLWGPIKMLALKAFDVYESV